VPNQPDRVTDDEVVAAMGKVSVDGAIFFSAFSMYQYDASYAVEVQQVYPGRFAIVKPVDPDDPAVWGLTTHSTDANRLVAFSLLGGCTSPRMPAPPGARSRVNSARSQPQSGCQTNPDLWTDDETHP
jgi:hypothetical protein